MPERVVIQIIQRPARVVAVVKTGPQGPQGASGESATGQALADHIADPTPHPAYDDLPDFVGLLENGMA